MKDYEYLSFDCYGTLIDWERGILNFFENILSQHNTSPQEVLKSYALFEAEAEHGEYKSYREILKIVFQKFSLKYNFEIEHGQEYSLSESVKVWPAFPDSNKALNKLQEKYKLVIISNIDDDLFAHSEALLGVKFDYIFTAQQMGSYKPSIHNFKYVKEKLNLTNDNWLHVAQSLYHDHVPASKMNIDSVWIKRQSAAGDQGIAPVVEIVPSRKYDSMESFVIDQISSI
jgi:2-haloacid dehalogenase